MIINNIQLDETQINAIKDNNKSVLVIAGAGAGKTLTILGKIKYLLDNKVSPDEILCISLTNETVNSLKDKISLLGYKIDVFTFHKLSLNILKDLNFNIANEKTLSFIIDEYFKSYIKYNKSSNIINKLLYSVNNINYLFKSSDYIKLKTTIETFIHLSKANNINLINLYDLYNKSILNEKELLHIILDISLIYKRELESTNSVDFDDMIIKAKDYVINTKYKYFIIDEFQDTSLIRYELVNKLIKINDGYLFAVGDDYQSIYRFSGCTLDLFINFNKCFKNTSIHKLKYTYRNSMELINVSVNFIMKNKKQINKNILSLKHLSKPIVIVFNKSIDEIISSISDDYLIIGRNNKDIENINYDNKMTIHKSKGLEANNVILVDSDSIPSINKNDNILQYVLPTKDYILYEEERRLFYVALTRTKNKIYIMVNKKISPFVKELICDYKEYIELLK